jgi:hypothetical protein
VASGQVDAHLRDYRFGSQPLAVSTSNRIAVSGSPSAPALRRSLSLSLFPLTQKHGSGFIRIRKALEDYPEVKLEINESGHGLLLSVLKVVPQPESRPVTDQVTDQVTAEVFRLLTVMRGPMSRLEIQSALGLKHLAFTRCLVGTSNKREASRNDHPRKTAKPAPKISTYACGRNTGKGNPTRNLIMPRKSRVSSVWSRESAQLKVNAICPAAIQTPMLAAGFQGRPDAFDALHQAHPGGRIGLPEEVAHLARYLIAEAPAFLNGSCLGLNGGIAGRLHDDCMTQHSCIAFA